MSLHHTTTIRLVAIAGLCWLASLVHAARLEAAEKPVSILAARISGHIHPSICRTREGTLIVVYQGANVLRCARSTDGGRIWSNATPIATSAKRPDLIREVKKYEVYPGTTDALPDSRVLVTWNYIADDKENDGYYEQALLYTLSSDQGLSWSEQQLIGPIEGKEKVESFFFTLPPEARADRGVADLKRDGVLDVVRTHLGAVRHNVLPWTDGRWLLPLRDGQPRLFDPQTGKLTMFSVVGSDGIEHEYQQIVRTAKGTLLAMGPVLLHSQDSGRSWTSIEGFPAVPDSRDNAEGRHLTALSDGRVLVTWGIGRDNKGLRYNLSPDDGRTWNAERTVILLPDTNIRARYYSARTLQLDARHVGTVFMNSEGVHFLRVSLDQLAK